MRDGIITIFEGNLRMDIFSLKGYYGFDYKRSADR